MLFADKTSRIDPSSGVFHLPFSVSKDGESLRLFDDKIHLVSVLHVPRLSRNQSFGLSPDGKPAVLDTPTPGAPNDGSVVLPMEEPVPMIVAPSVQKIRNRLMSLPPVRNFSPSRLPLLPKNPTQMTNAIHTTNPPRKRGMYFGSSISQSPAMVHIRLSDQAIAVGHEHVRLGE